MCLSRLIKKYIFAYFCTFIKMFGALNAVPTCEDFWFTTANERAEREE